MAARPKPETCTASLHRLRRDLYRNLTVLKAAGIDTTTPPKATWREMAGPDEEGEGRRQLRHAGPDPGLQLASPAPARHIGDKRKWASIRRQEPNADRAGVNDAHNAAVDRHGAPEASGPAATTKATKDLFITNQPAFPRRPALGQTYLCPGGQGLRPEIRLRAGARPAPPATLAASRAMNPRRRPRHQTPRSPGSSQPISP